MRAYISRGGRLTLVPETETEEYAALKWYDEACKRRHPEEDLDRRVKFCVEMQGLTVGPQPVDLIAVPMENDDDDE